MMKKTKIGAVVLMAAFAMMTVQPMTSMAAGICQTRDLRRKQCEPLRNRAWQLLWPERWKLSDRKQLQTRKVPE